MVPRLTPAVKVIIIATVSIYVLQLAGLNDFLEVYLALWPQHVKQGMVWQLVTYMFLHSLNPWHVLMNMLMLYFFGTAVESAWGSKRFAGFYVLCGLGAALVAMILDPTFRVVGASGAVFGVMVAFGLLFPEQVVLLFGVIPMKALALVLLLIAVEIAMLMGSERGESTWAHLGGAFAGFLYVKFSWRVVNWWKRYSAGQRRGFSGPTPITSRRSSRSSSRGRTGSAGQLATITAMPGSKTPPVVASSEELAIQKRADEILDKISREGMGSLSREERDILHKHSQILKAREGEVVKLDDYRS